MEPEHVNPLKELRRTQDELQFEKGVTYALKEIARGERVEELLFLSKQRVEMLTSMAERLKRLVR